MATRNLTGALNRPTVETLINKVYTAPDTDGMLASKEDRVRALRAAKLIEPDSKKINRKQLLDQLFPDKSGQSQGDNLRFFRSRLARESKDRLGIGFELTDDKQTNLPDDQRWLWFEGPDPTEMMVDQAIGEANYPEAKNFSPQNSVLFNSEGKPKRRVKYFISLAHDDDGEVHRFLAIFKRHLKGAKNFEFEVWQDTMIQIGQNWRTQIEQAIKGCEFGLLLVSPAFFASEFINESELPKFVASDGSIDGLKKAIPVCMKPVSWKHTDTRGVENLQVFFDCKQRAFSETAAKRDQEQFCKELFEKLIPLLPPEMPDPPLVSVQNESRNKRDVQDNAMSALANEREYPIQSYQPNKGVKTGLAKSIDRYLHMSPVTELTKETQPPSRRTDLLAINELVEWASDRSRAPYMAVLAELGIGKTTNLKEFCNRLTRNRRADPSLPLAVYLDLRLLVSLARKSKTSHDALLMINNSEKVVDWLLEQSVGVTGIAIKSADLCDLLRRNQVVIVFDSLDEILVQLGKAEAGTFVNTLYRFLPKDETTRRPLGKMIVACRTHYFPTEAAQNSTLLQQDRGDVRSDDFEALLLLPFDESQIRKYLSNSLEIQDSKRLDTIMALFASIHNLMDLSSRPLNLWLLKDQIPALERLKSQGRAIRAVDIYEMLVERWLFRDHEKHMMDEGLKPILMEHLAAALWASKQRTWTATQLDQWLAQFRQSNQSFQAQVVDQSIASLKEDLRNSTFVTREGDSDLFRFAHSSMQEYFLAKAMLSALNHESSDASSVWSGPKVSDETFDFLAELLQAAGIEKKAAFLEAMRALAANGSTELQMQVLSYFAVAHMKNLPKPILAGLTFNGLDLQHFHLAISDQTSSSLVNLRNTTWNSVFANESHFSKVDFTGATFNSMSAVGACFESCVFVGCSYSDSSFAGSDLGACEFGFVETQDIRDHLVTNPIFRDALFYQCFKNRDNVFYGFSLEVAKPRLVRGHSEPVSSIALSADGNRIVSGSFDHTIKLWDAQTGRCEQTLHGHQGAVISVAISPDGKQIVSGSTDNTIKLWDAQTGRCEQTLEGHRGWSMSVAISPDGKQIVSGSIDKTIKLWDAQTGRCEQTLEGHRDAVGPVTISPDGKRIVSGSIDKTIKLWDAQTGRCEQTLDGHQGSVGSVAISPDGKRIVSGSTDNTIKLWNTQTGRCEQTLDGYQGAVTSVAISPDGKQIMSGSDDNTIKLWDTQTGRCEQTLNGHRGRILSVAISPDGKQIVSGSDDNTIRLWDAQTGRCEQTLDAQRGRILSVAISPDGKQIVSGSSDNTIRLWNAQTGRYEQTFVGHQGAVGSVAISLDGKRIVSASDDNTIRLWNAQTGRCEQTLYEHQGAVMSVAISPDGRRILSGSCDKTIKIWDAQTGRCKQTLEGHRGWLTSVAISPDGKQIVSGSDDNTIKLWDAQTGHCEHTLDGHQGEIGSVAISPNGRQIVSGSFDKTIKLWDAQTGRFEQTFEGHQGAVMSVAISPDGKQIVSGSDDNTIKLWNAQTGRCEQTLDGHQGAVMSVAISADGNSLFSGANLGISVMYKTELGKFEQILLLEISKTFACVINPQTKTFVELSGDAWRYARWHLPYATANIGSQAAKHRWLPVDAFDSKN